MENFVRKKIILNPGKLHCVCACVCEQMDRFKGCVLLGQIMPLGMLKQANKEK